MSVDFHTIEHLGFRQEVVENTDPISGAGDYDNYHKFGMYTLPWGDFPALNPTYWQGYYGGSNEAVDNRLVSVFPGGNISSEYVNALEWYYLLGDANYNYNSDVVNGHHFEARDVGEVLKTRTGRFEDGALKKSLTGVKTAQYGWGINFSDPTARLTNTLAVLARDIVPAAYQTTLAPTYPNAISNNYKLDTNTQVIWDNEAGGGQHNLTYYCLNFDYLGSSNIRPIVPDGQTKPSELREGYYGHGVSFDIVKVTGETDIYEDYLGSKLDGDIFVSIFADATRYTQIDLTDTPLVITSTKTNLFGQSLGIYRCAGVGTNITVEAIDGLDDSYYNNFSGTDNA